MLSLLMALFMMSISLTLIYISLELLERTVQNVMILNPNVHHSKESLHLSFRLLLRK